MDDLGRRMLGVGHCALHRSHWKGLGHKWQRVAVKVITDDVCCWFRNFERCVKLLHREVFRELW